MCPGGGGDTFRVGTAAGPATEPIRTGNVGVAVVGEAVLLPCSRTPPPELCLPPVVGRGRTR